MDKIAPYITVILKACNSDDDTLRHVAEIKLRTIMTLLDLLEYTFVTYSQNGKYTNFRIGLKLYGV